MIYYQFIRGCDVCGSEDLGVEEMICHRCKVRMEVKRKMERFEAAAAFIDNHPNEPLPECFLPQTITITGGYVLHLQDGYYYSTDAINRVCTGDLSLHHTQLRFLAPGYGLVAVDGLRLFSAA